MELWPELADRCRPADLYRVRDYSREICAKVEGGQRKVWEFDIDRDGLEPAATRVLEQIQEVLREREAIGAARQGPDHFAAFNLYWQQRWCLNALLHLHSYKFAKETQIEVANGRPLTVCVGSGKRRPVFTRIGGRYLGDVSGGGCYRVFEDSLRLDARLFAHWCPHCRPRKTSALRAEERALQRRHRALLKLRAGREQNPASSLPAAGTIFFSQLERTNQL